MPFTPSHAVVALPFARTALPPAAVAVGAMAPDLPLFLRGGPLTYDLTHAPAAIPVTAAVALLLLLVWRCVLRPAVPGLVPVPLAWRLPVGWDAGPAAALRETFARRGAARPSWQGVLLLVVALAIGVASHILWDAFTHEDRAGVALIPVLGDSWGPWPAYRWLQYASGAAGLAGLALWAAWWLRRRAPRDPDPWARVPDAVRVAWWISLPVILLAGLVVGIVRFAVPFTIETPTDIAYFALVPAAALWGAGTLALCVVVMLRRTRPGA